MFVKVSMIFLKGFFQINNLFAAGVGCHFHKVFLCLESNLIEDLIVTFDIYLQIEDGSEQKRMNE